MHRDPCVLLSDVGYDSIMPSNVWDYARNDLPKLRRIVQGLLAELGPPDA